MGLEQASINLAREAYGSQPFTWQEFCLRYPSSAGLLDELHTDGRRSAADWLTLIYGPPRTSGCQPSQGSKP